MAKTLQEQYNQIKREKEVKKSFLKKQNNNSQI